MSSIGAVTAPPPPPVQASPPPPAKVDHDGDHDKHAKETKGAQAQETGNGHTLNIVA